MVGPARHGGRPVHSREGGFDAAATRALLAEIEGALAGVPPASGAERCFDRADLSAQGLGDRVHGAAWWDASAGGAKLGGCVLAGTSLRGADLSDADLSSVDLSGARCSGIVLARARLEGAVLRGADLVGADLTAVDAGQAGFQDALMEDAGLRGARLRFADLDGAVLDGADVSEADLWGARLERVAAERTSFRHARLDEARLGSADLARADLTGASLRRADLTRASLRGAILNEVGLEGADCTGTDFSGAVLPHVSLTGCTLHHARFAGAWLDRTRLRADQLGGAIGEEVAGEYAAAVDGYIVLEQNFRTLGRAEDASWAYRRRRRMGKLWAAQRTRAAWRARDPAGAWLAGLDWAADVAAEWLCDYGESVPRVLRALAVTLLSFALLYWATGSLEQRANATVTVRHFQAVDYLLFSLDSMTTVGTSEVGLEPAGQFGVLLSSVQTVLGTILLGLFGFVLGARMRT